MGPSVESKFFDNTGKYEATIPVEVIAGQVECPSTDVLKGHKKVKLMWEMVTPGWEIIAIHGLFYPVFTKKNKDGDGYKCKDKNPAVHHYDYTVVVGSITTKEVLVLDPTIRNGGN